MRVPLMIEFVDFRRRWVRSLVLIQELQSLIYFSKPFCDEVLICGVYIMTRFVRLLSFSLPLFFSRPEDCGTWH